MSSPQFSKREVLRFLLEQLTPVRILLDARREGVQVPQKFRSAPQLILEIGYRMNPPIQDLDIEGDGVRCTLSFSKQPFYCVLPWSAIWALISKHDGRGCQWVEDIPPEAMAIQHLQPPRMPPVLRSIPTKKDEPVVARPADEAKVEAPRADEARADEAKAQAPGAEEAAKAEAKAEETKAEAKAEAKPEAKAEEAKAEEAKAEEAKAEEAAKAEAAEAKPEKAEEIYEEPPAAKPDGKKKRELPSYLRVIK